MNDEPSAKHHGLHLEPDALPTYGPSNIPLQAVCACFSLAALMTDDYESFTEPQQDAALSHVVSSLRSE